MAHPPLCAIERLGQAHQPRSGPHPPIELPGAQSRVAWIKPGTEAELATVQGRWGLWIYNDAPLRELATQQGVR